MSTATGTGTGWNRAATLLPVGDPRRALSAPPLLTRFNRGRVLEAADLQVARRLGRLCGEDDERVLLAVALTVRAVRHGSVCLTLDDRAGMLVAEVEDPSTDLALESAAEPGVAVPRLTDDDLPEHQQWLALLGSSALVGGADVSRTAPVRMIEGRLYLDRYWRQEQLVRLDVDARLADPIGGVDPARLREVLERYFPAPDEDRQRLAAACAVHSRLTVLTGGPGTGKTTAVARILAVLQTACGRNAHGDKLSIALAAPTGKAAARLGEAVRAELHRLELDGLRTGVGEVDASTLHRLLGPRPGVRTRFRHDRHHHLSYDVVVVDETSMVSLSLMARLIDALRPGTRLILVGDPDQLASVDAGAVLGDLVARPAHSQALPDLLATSVPDPLPEESQFPQDRRALAAGVVRLVLPRRYGSVVAELARAVREGAEDDVVAVLRGGHAEIEFVEPETELPGEREVELIRADARDSGLRLVEAARSADAAAALTALESHRLLLAHRRGPFGVTYWSAAVERWVADAEMQKFGSAGRSTRRFGPWYPGRPLLVTANDRDVRLFNGDAGVVILDPEGRGVVAAFGDARNPVLVRPHRLPPVDTVHAMTVHRAQGSQFSRVTVLLPPPRSPLLTRELLYTALTRTQHHVRVVGSEESVRVAVRRPVRRASGLRYG